MQVIRQHVFRDDGVYRFGWQGRPGIKSKGSLTSF